jgi:hypothetical protein
MTLLTGYRLAVAPKFHLDANWPGRLGLGPGVEEVEGKFFPRGPWRSPTPQELALLVGSDQSRESALPAPGNLEPAPTPPPEAIYLFQVPEHLQSAWWALLDASAGSGGPLVGFDEFAAQVGAFLAFKGLAPSGPMQMEAIVTAVGERSIRRDPDTGRPSGLGSTRAPWTAWPGPSVPAPRLHAVVNLGDEPSGVVLINLPPAELAAELDRRALGGSTPTTVGELVERFLRVCSSYPTVRVQLGPGEGCRVPAAGLVLDGDPTGKGEPDLLLLISTEEPGG